MHAAKNSRKLTYGGILLALLMVSLYVYTIIPSNKLTVMMFVSFISGIVLIETDLKYTIIFFFSSIILSLIFPVNKLSLLLYYSFFGSYGIIKYIIEKLDRRIIEYILKIIYFIIICIINYSFASIFLPDIITQFSLYIVLLVSIVAFIVYDYLYTLIMAFYIQRISKLRRQ